MKKIITLLLILLCVTLCSCNENKTPSHTDNPSGNNQQYIPEYKGDNMSHSNVGYVEGSIHQYNITENSNYVVQNGTTEYKILVPAKASATLNSNVKDFIGLFKEATGVEFEIVEDSNIDNNQKYFSVGNTKLFEGTGIKLDYNQIKSQGFIIKTVNNSVYFAGYTDQACLNALYQYLTLIANYRYLGPDTYILNKLDSVKLYNYDVIDAPDIEHRVASYSFVNGSNSRRYRISDSAQFIPVNGLTWHNTFNYLPKEKYQKEHPDWYSVDGTQVCYTARGDEDSLKEMQEEVLEVMKEHLIKYPDRNIITFSIQDSNTFCTCATCKASYVKYNYSNAAVVVKFLNTISDMMNDWFLGEGSEYKRDLKILFFAYLSTNIAPAKYDDNTNTWTPIDSEVVCRDNVCPFFADIRGDYTKSYYDEKSANSVYARSMKAWTECSTNLFFWTYSTNFHYYLTPYYSFDAMLDSYKFAVSCDAMYLFDQAQFNQGQAATGWSFLKQYITSRGAWDCNVNANDLYDEFFSEFYSKEAGPIMRELFDEYRILGSYQTNVLGYTGPSSIYHNPFKEEYWSKQTLLRWIERFDDALAAIEIYKDTAPGQYAKYYGHITSERVQYTYLLLKIYSSSLSEDELVYYKAQFHSDAEGNGMLYENELGNSLVTNLFK